ncbi:uncharacterized protein EV154DRAFT_587884 [Mucor mucedo]|uniref:uncharacterized protein n=1 Tax=Mucor mucedo TaxID=29922 RepID=UPI00221FF890|nr:uncharacterized protein EV154DRAFT_587884 [Mucor mucedo]KAI7891803.1 hypothetical protein EV154DRAFT_587884 [Mucor mucedo]
MKLYQFCKNVALHPDHTVVYSGVKKHEGRVVDEVNIGAFLNASAVNSEYVIKGDNTPRVIYRVYKLDRPEQEKDVKGSVSDFCNIIDTLHNSKKESIYEKYLKKFTRKAFVFFACLDNFDTDCSGDFYVTEKTLNFDDLNRGVSKWNCVYENMLRVDKSSFYFKLEQSIKPRQAMIFFYMYCIKSLMCTGCYHTWSHQDLLDLLQHSQAYKEATTIPLTDDEAYCMQKKFKCCKLWTQFINNENAFARRTPGLRHSIRRLFFSSW